MKATQIHHKVSFSWEKHPGISIIPPKQEHNIKTTRQDDTKLPLPPVLTGCPKSFTGLLKGTTHPQYVPLPPCHFNPPPLIALRRDERDPFLAAYMECTKTKKSRRLSTLFGKLSCKQRSAVRDDGMVRIRN